MLTGCDTVGGAQLASDATFGAIGTGAGYAVSEATGEPWAGVAVGLGIFAISRLANAKRLFYSPQLKFQEAVLRGNTVGVEKYASSSYIDKPINGMPPVFYAAINNDSQMLQLLVRRGARMSGRYSGRSLAYVVATYGQRSTANLVVRLGGGTPRDVSDGWAAYVAYQRQQDEYRRMRQALAMQYVMTQLRCSDYSGPAPGGCDEYQQDAQRYGGISDAERARLEDDYRAQARQAEQYRQQNMPYYDKVY
ncbi:hypothetical protein DB346_12990 [Verrucomicrobia bacterium LW23]|nr:hypothetical protein DB346_12990 [Verrucomicrobia bacterium LW23]